jgi:hypothetical protein
MKRWLHKIEVIVDKSIPYLLILLLVLIVGEIWFGHEIEPYRIIVSLVDGAIIFIFVLDLIFKYMRIKKFPKFFRKYWFEIIAVFPAFLVLRIIEEFAYIAGLGEAMRASLPQVLKIQKEGKVLVGEIERTRLGISRLRYFSRFARPLSRFPRFFEAFSFYEKPTGRHHPGEK